MTEVLDRDVYETHQGKLFLSDDGSLRQLAERIVKLYPGHFKYCNVDEIEFILIEGEKSDYLGKAVKIPPMYRLFMNNKKFIIIFNTMMIEHTTAAKTDLIMYHELLHCDTDTDSIRDHDVLDFGLMLKTFGDDWRINKESILPADQLRELTPWAMPGSAQTASGKDKPNANVAP